MAPAVLLLPPFTWPGLAWLLLALEGLVHWKDGPGWLGALE
jgi:hypothetical protein